MKNEKINGQYGGYDTIEGQFSHLHCVLSQVDHIQPKFIRQKNDGTFGGRIGATFLPIIDLYGDKQEASRKIMLALHMIACVIDSEITRQGVGHAQR